MNRLLLGILNRVNGDRGASMVEYALLIVLIATIAVIAITVAGQEVSESYSRVGEGFSN